MDPFATSHFSDRALLHDLRTLDAQDCRTTAVMLSRVAEVEERGLHLREGQPTMHDYCVEVLHWCEGTASRRICAARVARRFPVLLVAIAEGRIHVTGVLMLSRYLTSGNVDELLAAATHKSRAGIAQVIAERFPRPDLPEVLRPVAWPGMPAMAMPVGASSPEKMHATILTGGPLTPGPAGASSPEKMLGAVPPGAPPTPGPARASSPEKMDANILPAGPPTPGAVRPSSPEKIEPRAPRAELKPLAPQRFAFQCTFDQETYDLLQDVRALMGHEVPTGELAVVLKGALKLAKAQLEKRKFAATDRPGHSTGCTSARGIPAAVKRAVRERDGGQCAFVSESGRRCPERARLEFDHAQPVARGGASTAENVRLLCRAHNQHAAEAAFGSEFMERKRAEATRTRWP